MRTPPRTTRIAALAAFAASALAAILVWSAPPVFAADNVPDWLREAAHETLPEYPKETVAVVLLDEQETWVKENGEIETRQRTAYKLLRPEARQEYSSVSVGFDNETKLSYFRAWTLTSNGKEMEVKEKDAVLSSPYSDELFSDVHFKRIAFPEAEPGNIVGYEFIRRERPFMFEDAWSFQSAIPTRRARFSLHMPVGWEFSDYWYNFKKQEPQSSANNLYVWEIENIPGIEIEPVMPDFRTIESRMDIKYFPRDASLRAKSAGTWNDIGLWYAGLTSSSRVPSPALQQKVAELTAGISDPLQKIRAITTYMQRQIRYVAIEVGIGGLQPHPAADVFKHQYGDCKDKATLLSTMLKQIGIESYYVLIDTDRGIVNPDFPSLRGNHVILAIRLPDEIQDAKLYAVVNDPQLGRILFFDPTNEYVPLGYLPYYLQQNYGLVAAPNTAKLILLPLMAPATNRLMRTATLTLSPAGSLRGDVEELRWGSPAAERRETFMESKQADRAKVFERFLGTSLNNFTLTGASIGNLDNYDETLTLNYKFVATEYAKTSGDLLIVRPRVMGEKGSSILAGKPRKYPIELTGTSLETDVFDITLPAGYVVDELPEAVRAECNYATYKSDFQVKDNVLHYSRTYEIKGIIVPTEKLPEVRDFFHQIAADEKSSAVLRRSTP